jgi:hypothetical protein
MTPFEDLKFFTEAQAPLDLVLSRNVGMVCDSTVTARPLFLPHQIYFLQRHGLSISWLITTIRVLSMQPHGLAIGPCPNKALRCTRSVSLRVEYKVPDVHKFSSSRHSRKSYAASLLPKVPKLSLRCACR